MTSLATWVKVNGQGDFLGEVKGQDRNWQSPGRGQKNRVNGSDTPLQLFYTVIIEVDKVFCIEYTNIFDHNIRTVPSMIIVFS